MQKDLDAKHVDDFYLCCKLLHSAHNAFNALSGYLSLFYCTTSFPIYDLAVPPSPQQFLQMYLEKLLWNGSEDKSQQSLTCGCSCYVYTCSNTYSTLIQNEQKKQWCSYFMQVSFKLYLVMVIWLCLKAWLNLSVHS